MSSINIQIRGFADETYIQLLFVYNSYKQKCHLALVLFATKRFCGKIKNFDAPWYLSLYLSCHQYVRISIEKGTNDNIYQLYIVII